MGQPVIDIGILTIRDDEFRAVLGAFKDSHDVYKGRHREYTLRTADAGHGARYRLAILRQVEQGNGEAQEAARDLIDDLEPSLLLVVGIAGGLPSDDITLGDVVLSTRVHDFSLEARTFQEGTTYNVGGGPISKSIAAGIANLGGREEELGEWWAELPAKPPVNFTPTKLYGPQPWKSTLRGKLQVHYGKRAEERPPTFSAGPMASSDRLVKDPKLLFPWITTARGILAIEMESAGVHRATRERTSMLSIRGLSDIVGLKRHDAWTKYACASAAAFTRAYLRTRPVPLRETPQTGSAPALPSGSEVDTDHQEARVEESFANLIPLQHFPDTIYVAPALTKTRKQAWAQLKRRAPRKSPDYVSGSWTLHDGNLYSLVDPEESRLKTIIDLGLSNSSTRESGRSPRTKAGDAFLFNC
jgi:nucleoside phosphorylase